MSLKSFTLGDREVKFVACGEVYHAFICDRFPTHGYLYKVFYRLNDDEAKKSHTELNSLFSTEYLRLQTFCLNKGSRFSVLDHYICRLPKGSRLSPLGKVIPPQGEKNPEDKEQVFYVISMTIRDLDIEEELFNYVRQ